MRDKIPVIVFVFLIGFIRCTEAPKDNSTLPLSEIKAVDSFWVGKLNSSQYEFTSFNLLNDTTIIGFDHFNQLNFYTKRNHVFGYKASKTLTPEHPIRSFFSMNKNKFYVFSGKTIYTYDSIFQVKDSSRFISTLPYLKNDYFPACSNFLPLMQFGDTLVTYYSNSNAADFFTAFKEPAFMEFTLKKTIASVNTYLAKPRNLEDYDINFFSFHAAINGSLYKAYNGFDTLYQYNRYTHQETKIPLQNKDYILPERATSKNLFDFKYLTKRGLSSFSYCGMFYNPVTGHLVLFYNTSVETEGDKNPTGREQKLKAIVLDQHFDIIKYLVFEKEFLPTMTFFQYTNKGLAMGLYNENPTDEPTKFYIYNF